MHMGQRNSLLMIIVILFGHGPGDILKLCQRLAWFTVGTLLGGVIDEWIFHVEFSQVSAAVFTCP
jgi:hypothetical protein